MKLAHDQHVDWPEVLNDLVAAGKTLDALGKAIGANADRLKKWRDIECQPRHDDGERLLAVWCAVTGKARADAPVVSRYA